MQRLNEQNNFLYLTLALLVLLLSLPLLKMFEGGIVHWITRLLVFFMLLITYASLDFGRWWRHFMAVILLVLAGSTLLHEFDFIGDAGLLHLVLLMLFFGSVAYSAGHRVLLRGAIDGNKIIGSIAIYLLLGLLWAMLYLITLEFVPGAFNGIEGGQWEDNFFDVIYFSFVTLATLGYGDISPTLPLTKSLAYLQAVTGTFYMAVVVASLIGASRASAKHQQ
jgi:hypothetical protein